VKGGASRSGFLMRAHASADERHVRRDFSPVVAAQALLAHGIAVGAVLTYLQRTWGLSEVDGQAAIAAGQLLVGRELRYPVDDNAPSAFI
jgi:hypothetical protein